jgi:hypothetical protein
MVLSNRPLLGSEVALVAAIEDRPNIFHPWAWRGREIGCFVQSARTAGANDKIQRLRNPLPRQVIAGLAAGHAEPSDNQATAAIRSPAGCVAESIIL